MTDRAVDALVTPGREHFRDLARDHRVVPVLRTLLADLTTPLAAFARLCGPDATGPDGQGRPGFLLESVDHGGRWSRWSFIGRDPRARLVVRGGVVTLTGEVPADVPTDRGVLVALEALLEHHRAPTEERFGAPLPPLHSGVVGYLGYDVVREVERLPDVPADDRGWPDAVLSVIGELAAYDHWSQQVTLVANAFVPDGASDAELDAAYDDAVARLDRMAADGATPLDEPLVRPPERTDESPEVESSMPGGLYESAVEVAKEHILAGDVFQVVLAQRFGFTTSADPLDVYRTLRQVNPSPYMYYVREEELTLVGCSPEPMVQLLDGTVISRPIAGTRFRGRTDEHDRRLAAELSEHPKERAEHLMLVDLARNDVGRVVEFGTCHVDELMTLERYSHVMHLTSQVSGRLAEGRTPIDVLRATLPAGTVSGAPKVRAMEVIDELEPVKRGPYAGVVGYVDFSGNIDTAIAIRTMVVDRPGPDGRRAAFVQAGAGVVADSVPADEELETRNKAKALLSAVPAAERMTAQRRAARRG
jgi:anthranilate synthase component 1